MREQLKSVVVLLENMVDHPEIRGALIRGETPVDEAIRDALQTIDSALEQPDFNPLRDIDEFMLKFGPYYRDRPRVLSEALMDFRQKFMIEEATEYRTAATEALNALEVPMLIPLENRDAYIAQRLAEMLDALVDLVYVALGTAHLQSFDFAEAWRRVHAANMKKVRATDSRQSIRGSEFDVVKPRGWQKPDHTDLVENHSHLVAASDDSTR